MSSLAGARAMGLGTLVSRATGFLRTVMVLAALGAGMTADAYNSANVLPNIVYELLLGGILSSVIVPLIVAAREHDPDKGEAYTARLLTIATTILAGATLVAVAAAPLLVSLYTEGFTEEQQDLAVFWARIFLPQLLFYGLTALAGAVLSTHGRFAAVGWAPVANNVVVIGVAAAYLAVAQGENLPSTGEAWLIGAGTTLGVVIQTLLLYPALKKAGVNLKPRWDWKNANLEEAKRLAGWVLVYVLTNQAGLLVITNIATDAGATAARTSGDAAGYTTYASAWQLFQLPYAIITVSIITVLVPQLAKHGTLHEHDKVRETLSRGLRLSAALLVPGALLLAALGPDVATAALAYGNVEIDDARRIGWTLSALALGLVPFTAFHLQARTLYALKDSKSVAIVNLYATGTAIAVNLAAASLLPSRWVVVGLGAGTALSYVVGTILVNRVVAEKTGGKLDALKPHLQLLVASLPGTVLAATTSLLIHAALDGRSAAWTSLVVGSIVATAAYIACSRYLRIKETSELLEQLRPNR